MVIKILMNLGTTDIAVCRRVNRHWQTLIDTRHLLARSFYSDCHLTQRINSVAVEYNLTVERYRSHIRGWLTDFSDRGRATAKQLDHILKDKYFPEVLFFSIPKLLLNSNELTCQNVATIRHSGVVRDASLSPDGKYLVTVSTDSAAKIWELEGGQCKEKVTIRHSAWVTSASFSPDGKLLVTTSHDCICKIWRLEDDQWQEKVSIQHSVSLINASFSPDGKHLVIVSTGDSAKIWRLDDDGRWQEKVTIRHSGQEMTVAQFSPDGKRLVSTSINGIVKIWKLDGGQWKEKFIFEDSYRVMNARFSPDGKHLVTVVSKESPILFGVCFQIVRLWELVDVQKENETIQQWQNKANIPHFNIVFNVHFSLDGKHFATASRDCTVKICGLEGGKWQEKAIIWHSGPVANASFSRNGKFLVTASYDGTATICRLEGGKWQEIVTIEHSKEVTNASFGPDDYQLMTASRDKTAKIWVLNNKENDDDS